MVVCEAVVATVIAVFTTVVGPFPVADAAPHVASVGRPLHVKLTAVLKLLEVTMPTVVLPDMPGLVIVTSVGPDTPVNPGWIVKLTGVVLLLLLKLASPA